MKYIFTISLIILSLCTAREGRCQGTWAIDSTNGFTPVGDATACVLNGRIYIIGGSYSTTFSEATNDVQIFDPITHSWTFGPEIPIASFDLSCNALNEKIYAFEGDSVEIFDPAKNTWRPGPPMPTARVGLGSCALNGKMYVIGGDGIITVDIFDPATETWSTGPPIPAPRTYFALSALGGKIYVMGGYGYNGNEPVDSVEIFDSATNAWSVGPSLPGKLSDCAASAADGKIYVMGGWDGGNTASKALEIFDTSTNIWSIGPTMPTGRLDVVSAAVNGKIYAIGGLDLDGDAVSANEVFTPGPLGVAEGGAADSGLKSYPNPFSQSTTITFTSPESGAAEVTIVNLLGAEVAQLFSGTLDAGDHSFTWDASGLPQGTYWCNIRMNGKSKQIPIIFVR